MERLRTGEALAWAGAHVALLIAISLFAFHRNVGYLFPGGDGIYMLHTLMNQSLWSPLAFGFDANPLQGLSQLGFPLNTRLMPGYAVPALFLGVENATTPLFQEWSYTVFSVELFAATFCLSRVLGVSLGASLAAAWAVPLLALPYFGFPLLFPLLLFVPHVATGMADCAYVLAAGACLAQQDSSGPPARLRNLLLWLAMLGLLAHLVIVSPVGVILYAPVIGMGVIGVFWGSDRRGRIVLAGALAIAVVLLAGTGFAAFVVGALEYTAARFWSEELANDMLAWQYVSAASFNPAGVRFLGCAVFGVVVAVVLGDRRLKYLAIVSALFMAAVFAGGAVAVAKDTWRGPFPVYFEVLAWPLYAIFAAYGVAKAAEWLVSRALSVYARFRRRRIESAPGEHSILACALPYVLVFPAIACYLSLRVDNPTRIWGPFPPPDTPMVSYLKERIALSPGDVFRGRVATFIGVDRQGQVGWLDIVGRNAPRVAATGNDYYWSGLWPGRVPTLFEYTPSMSPAYFRAFTRLLGRPGDRQVRNVVFLRRPEARALALFGVRYVISDARLPAPFRLQISEKTTDEETLHLYEVPDANLGSYSVEDLVVADSFDGALDRMSESAFDPRRTAVVFEPGLKAVRGSLVPADKSVLRLERGATVVVEAQSAGRTLLILPFEFSRCLTLSAQDAPGNAPRLYRVNAVETGILFERRLNARIRYFTGPFRNSTCRLQDGREFAPLAGKAWIYP